MGKFTCTRRIEIDAAHRVPTHGSKCRNWHGHRYVIEATCEGELQAGGEQSGMVMDFGFLKAIMIEVIHDRCDHGMIIWHGDPQLGDVAKIAGKLETINYIPTAENLARYWFLHLERMMVLRAAPLGVKLVAVDVWETPNCRATFRHEDI